MARDKASTEAREQRLYADLQWAKAHGSKETQQAAQRVYDRFIKQHNPKNW